MKLYAGMDIHLDQIQVCVENKEGEEVSKQVIPATSRDIKEYLEGLSSRNITIAIEACGLWRGVYKAIKGLGYEVVLTSPKKVKDIAGVKKTDKVDARILADLLRTGYMPRVWIPDEDILLLRDITRHQVKLSWLETSAKNRIKCRLSNKGYKYPKNLWKQGNENKLKELDDIQINQFLEIKQLVSKQMEQIGKTIKETGKGIEEIELLRKHILGIDYFSALLFYAEIGDVNRFDTVKQLHSYAGLAPGIYQSANTLHTFEHKHRNRYLKWICYVCSTVALKCDGPVRDTYQRVLKKKGKCVARRAAARKLLTMVWVVLKTKQPYHGPFDRTGPGHPHGITRL